MEGVKKKKNCGHCTCLKWLVITEPFIQIHIINSAIHLFFNVDLLAF